MTTVLLVNNYTDNRQTLRALLEQQHFFVLQAGNGADALLILQKETVDLIVADILMPDMDGYALCVRCKHDTRLRQIPFVFCTATYTDAKDVELGLRLGANGYIIQPAEPKMLIAQLKSVLAEHSPNASQATEPVASDDLTYYRLYNELLVRQLENKTIELEQANQALSSSEAALKRSQEIAHVGHWTWDTQSNRVFWSDEMCRIFGVDPASFDGDLDAIVRRTIHPDDLPSVLDANTAVVQEQRPGAMGYRVVWPDGSVRYVWAAPADRVVDAQGNIIQLSGIIQDITERAQANEELLQSLRRVDVASQAAGLGIWEYDIQNDHEIWDEHMYALYGVRREDFEPTYAGWARLIHPLDLQRIENVDAVVAVDTKKLHYRFRIIRPDGVIRHIEMYAEVVRDAEGKPSRLVGVDRDVTEWVESEQRMQLQSAALGAAANAIVITALDGSIEWINPAFTQLTGYTTEESLGRNLGDLVRSGLQPAAYYEQMWESILSGQVWQGELVNRRKDGSLYTEEQAITPVLDASGEVNHFVAVKQDVSARKQHEREMVQIMRSVPDGLLLLDSLYRVVTATPRAEDYLVLVAGVHIGETLTHLGDRPLAELLTSPPAGQQHTVQVAERIFEVATRPVEAEPASSGWVLVIRDVTAELAAQQQLQRQERLAAIGQLAAGIAHDFNNIMSVITVYAQLLEATPALNERAREQLRIIDRQAMRATDMIRQILDFSRRSVIERQTFDLLPLLSEQVRLLERTLPEDIEITLIHSAGPFVVHGDSTRLAQAIMNLAINARDAMPEGGKLTFDLGHVLTTSLKDAPLPNMGIGEWVRLTIADTGVGMAPVALQHIFEPFYTTKEPGSGTGLGLPQVHGIIGQHGGHIGVDSQVGVGTRITIYLPAIPIITAEARELRTPANLPQGRGETVLLVEDEPVLRETMADLLLLWNYDVMQAANGQQALDILSTAGEQVALVLTDVVMPVMGGIGLLKQMRQRGIVTPVIIVTGHPLRDELEGLRQLGLTAWLNKPPSTAQLAHTLARVLQG